LVGDFFIQALYSLFKRGKKSVFFQEKIRKEIKQKMKKKRKKKKRIEKKRKEKKRKRDLQNPKFLTFWVNISR